LNDGLQWVLVWNEKLAAVLGQRRVYDTHPMPRPLSDYDFLSVRRSHRHHPIVDILRKNVRSSNCACCCDRPVQNPSNCVRCVYMRNRGSDPSCPKYHTLRQRRRRYRGRRVIADYLGLLRSRTLHLGKIYSCSLGYLSVLNQSPGQSADTRPLAPPSRWEPLAMTARSKRGPSDHVRVGGVRRTGTCGWADSASSARSCRPPSRQNTTTSVPVPDVPAARSIPSRCCARFRTARVCLHIVGLWGSRICPAPLPRLSPAATATRIRANATS
jgi:hypothetical protein